MLFYASTHCDDCGKSLNTFEYGLCQNCKNKYIRKDKIETYYIEKKTVREVIKECYIDKDEIRKIIENYSKKRKNGRMIFEYKNAPEFIQEILELVGYKMR